MMDYGKYYGAIRIMMENESRTQINEANTDEELRQLHRLAAKHGYALVSIDSELEWKDDDA